MDMKTITVVAAFQAKPGKENELRAALMGLLAPTRQEAGCVNYDLHASAENPAKFLFTKIGPASRRWTRICSLRISKNCCRL